MKILAIETSCDETGIAVLEASGGLKAPRFKVLANLVASQIKIHRPFGGVVPNLAKREHLKNLPILWKKIARQGRTGDPRFAGTWDKGQGIDLITVTVGPGLEPALWTGIEFAKGLARGIRDKGQGTRDMELGTWDKGHGTRDWKPIKLLGANHLEGHLYSFLLPSRKPVSPIPSSMSQIFPAVALIVSGGHTILLRMESFSKWTRLGETRDDAAGEAFDKVARLLELPYPGGPEIEKLAAKGNPFAISFPRPMLDQKNYDFSFSGLKTAVLYYLKGLASSTNNESVTNKRMRNKIRALAEDSLFVNGAADIAASFQQAAIDVLVQKTRRAAEECAANSVILCGGVAANKRLRKAMERMASLIGARFFVPDFRYNLDNAAMIGAAGYLAWLRKKKYPLKADGGMEI